jgi:hypothetical protein
MNAKKPTCDHHCTDAGSLELSDYWFRLRLQAVFHDEQTDKDEIAFHLVSELIKYTNITDTCVRL